MYAICKKYIQLQIIKSFNFFYFYIHEHPPVKATPFIQNIKKERSKLKTYFSLGCKSHCLLYCPRRTMCYNDNLKERKCQHLFFVYNLINASSILSSVMFESLTLLKTSPLRFGSYILILLIVVICPRRIMLPRFIFESSLF